MPDFLAPLATAAAAADNHHVEDNDAANLSLSLAGILSSPVNWATSGAELNETLYETYSFTCSLVSSFCCSPARSGNALARTYAPGARAPVNVRGALVSLQIITRVAYRAVHAKPRANYCNAGERASVASLVQVNVRVCICVKPTQKGGVPI